MKIYKPSRFGLYSSVALLSLVCTIGTLASLRFLVRYPIVMYTAVGIFVFFGFAAGTIILPLCFAKASYRLTENEVTKLSGIIFQKNQSIKIENIQYVTCLTTPFSQLTGLNFIILHSPGGKLGMWFLSPEDTAAVACHINSAIRRQGEVYENK